MKILWIKSSKSKSNAGISKAIGSIIDKIDQLPIHSQDILYAFEGKSLILKCLNLIIYTPLYILFNKHKYDKILLEINYLSFLTILDKKRIVPMIAHVFEKMELDSHQQSTLKQTVTNTLKQIFIPTVEKLALYANQINTISHFSSKKIVEKYQTPLNKINICYCPCNISKPIINTESRFSQCFHKIKNNKKVLLYVGSELLHKNFITLLYVLNKLNQHDYCILKLGQPGNKSNQEMHKKYISENSLDVTFFSNVTENELSYAYHQAFCYIHPSIKEGFGMPPVEAQLSGLPVISTHSGALEEVLGDSCLVIKDPYNVDEYVAAIEKLNNENLRKELIDKGYKNADRFNPDILVHQWIGVLEGNKSNAKHE